MYKHALLFQADDSLSVLCKINVLSSLAYVFVNVRYDVIMVSAFYLLENYFALWTLGIFSSS